MLILLAAYLGGVFTLFSPCILPVLPFVLSRADRPFGSHGLPLLAGMALAFAAVASLAAVGGGWVVETHETMRWLALAAFALFGMSLLWPSLAAWLSRPWVALGGRLVAASPAANGSHSRWAALAQGVGTGLLWTPCAGPILGLILTGAALHGASVGSALLLLAYSAGACSALAVVLLLGRRIGVATSLSLRGGALLRRIAGVAVLASVSGIALGADTGLLARLSSGPTAALENLLLQRLGGVTESGSASPPADMPRTRSPALPVEGLMPALDGAVGWINSPALTTASLRGKVVLVDFWTYSCINCLRTLPYVRAWADKYRSAGLVVLGVHTPEFAFERKLSNVQRASQDLGVTFPVAVDSDYKIWRAFRNQYWPALYFVDAQGRIRHHQFGEGSYAQSERVIQQLLREAGQTQLSEELAAPQGSGTQAAPPDTRAASHETYLGFAQAQGFVPAGGLVPGRAHDYRGASALRGQQWALEGRWQVEDESALGLAGGGRVMLRFRARDLHMVLGSADDGQPVRFRVRIDGKPPLDDHGTDIDREGRGTITGHRLYQLLRQQQQSGDRLFEIEFLDPGARAYAFTFG